MSLITLECDVTVDFRCIVSMECISNFKTCDGVYDCRDGSDESGDECSKQHFMSRIINIGVLYIIIVAVVTGGRS